MCVCVRVCVCAHMHVYGYFWKGHQEFTCYLCTRTVQISVCSSFIYTGCWSKHCFYIFIVCICLRVYIGTHMLWRICGDQSTAYGSWFSSPIIWVLGIELRLLSDLETGSFICWAISLAWKHCFFLSFFFVCVCCCYLSILSGTYIPQQINRGQRTAFRMGWTSCHPVKAGSLLFLLLWWELQASWPMTVRFLVSSSNLTVISSGYV